MKTQQLDMVRLTHSLYNRHLLNWHETIRLTLSSLGIPWEEHIDIQYEDQCSFVQFLVNKDDFETSRKALVLVSTETKKLADLTPGYLSSLKERIG